MNKFTLTLIVSILVASFQRGICFNLDLHRNLFHIINGKLQNTVNKVFTLLKLNKTFSNQYENQLLIFMSNNMNSLAETNYISFKKLETHIKMANGSKLNDTLFKLDTTLDEVLTENHIKTTFFIDRDGLPEGAPLNVSDIGEAFNIFKEEIFKELNDTERKSVDLSTSFKSIKDVYRTHIEFKKHVDFKPWRASNQTISPDLRRMFNGKYADVNRFPFIASVHVLDEFTCAGSIIARQFIITASTCLQSVYNNPKFIEEYPQSVGVRVGSDFSNKDGRWHYVEKVFFHPNYNPSNLENNLVILKMDKSLRFKKNLKMTRRIEYKRSNGVVPPTVKGITLVGWGNKDEKDENINKLTYAQVSIYDLKNCIEVYTEKFVTQKHFCIGYIDKGSGACPKDIGAPGIVSSVLVGVVSFGPPVCGTPDAPTVFTNLAHYTDWIDSVVKEQPKTQSNLTTTKSMVTHPRGNTTLIAMNDSAMNTLFSEPGGHAEKYISKEMSRSKTTPNPKNEKLIDKIINVITKSKKKKNKILRKLSQPKYSQAVKLLQFLLSEVMDEEELASENESPFLMLNISQKFTTRPPTSIAMPTSIENATSISIPTSIAISTSNTIPTSTAISTPLQTKLFLNKAILWKNPARTLNKRWLYKKSTTDGIKMNSTVSEPPTSVDQMEDVELSESDENDDSESAEGIDIDIELATSRTEVEKPQSEYSPMIAVTAMPTITLMPPITPPRYFTRLLTKKLTPSSLRSNAVNIQMHSINNDTNTGEKLKPSAKADGTKSDEIFLLLLQQPNSNLAKPLNNNTHVNSYLNNIGKADENDRSLKSSEEQFIIQIGDNLSSEFELQPIENVATKPIIRQHKLTPYMLSTRSYGTYSGSSLITQKYPLYLREKKVKSTMLRDRYLNPIMQKSRFFSNHKPNEENKPMKSSFRSIVLDEISKAEPLFRAEKDSYNQVDTQITNSSQVNVESQKESGNESESTEADSKSDVSDHYLKMNLDDNITTSDSKEKLTKEDDDYDNSEKEEKPTETRGNLADYIYV